MTILSRFAFGIVSLALLAAPSASAQNLIQNTGFESGELAPWTGGGNVNAGTGASNEGTYHVRLQSPQSGPQYVALTLTGLAAGTYTFVYSTRGNGSALLEATSIQPVVIPGGNQSSWTDRSVDLVPVGGTITIRFTHIQNDFRLDAPFVAPPPPPPGTDADGDGIDDIDDNCPLVANPDQADNDGDGIGDACDPDDDNDGVLDGDDNCPLAFNPGQEDNEGDGIGDVCDPDDDNDGIDDGDDNCQFVYNPAQEDFDGDGLGDACDPDVDNDGVDNDGDLCAFTYIPEAVVPTSGKLNPNHWALLDGDTIFDTLVKGKGKGAGRSYTTTDTAGCSCEQIIDELDKGDGHRKFGCSNSVMDEWTAFVAGTAGKGSVAPEAVTEVPSTIQLDGNYPNPFNPSTTIRFALPAAARVTLAVYDLMGRQVAMLVDGTLDAGSHETTFEASSLPSGTYLYRLATPNGALTGRMSLVK